MKRLLLAATALAMLGGTAYAQTSVSGSDSSSTAINSSGSQSSSVSNPKVNVIGNPIGNGASSSTSGAKATANTQSAARSSAVGNSSSLRNSSTTNTTINVSGGSGSSGNGAAGTGEPASARTDQYIGYGGSYTVRNTPEVIPPSVVGGNPCAVGASGGVALPGFGLALGGTWADRACERRQQAALLFNMGEQKVAMELMCQDDNIRSAMRVGGRPCTIDTAAAQPSAMVAAAPMTTAPAAVAAPVVKVAAAPAAPRPEWCAKAAPTTEASRAYVAQVCGK